MSELPDIRISQLQILNHTLGLDRPDRDRKLRQYHRETKNRECWEATNRNYFASSEEGKDHDAIKELCELGLMKYGSTHYDLKYYFVTQLGKKLCGIYEGGA